jgi:CheY-like chemotaxis protein/DNA-binding XRE family transcriptional regulator
MSATALYERHNLLVIMDVKKEFGTVVRSRRTRLGLSQGALAQRAALPRTYITDIERGTRNLTLENISKLAGAFGLPIGQLFQMPEEADGGDGHAMLKVGRGDLVDILIIQNNPADIELTLKAFKQAKMTNRVRVERDGEAALDFLFYHGPYQRRQVERLPDAVLLDLNLPKMTGLDVLRRIKQDPRTSGSKVVVMCNRVPDKDVSEAMRLGAAGYITKPVNFYSFCQITPQLEYSWTLLHPSITTPMPTNGFRSKPV